MKIIFFTGLPGGGKTIGMVYFACADYQLGRRIYSNFDLTFPKIKENPYMPQKIGMSDLIETLYALDHDIECKIQPDQYPKTIALDELHTMWNSYRYNTNEALDLGFFVDQHRKIQADIYYSSQHEKEIPPQLRRITTHLCYCESIPPGETDHPLGFRYLFTSRWDNEIVEVKIPITEVMPLFDLYRTYQRITPKVTKRE